MSQNPYAPQPASNAPLTAEQERSWAIGTHVATGAATALSFGTLGFVAALVVYLMYKDRGPFVRHHVANALNVQLNGALWAVAISVFGVLTLGLGFVLLFAVPVVMVLLHVLGALSASRGTWENPPLTIRFIR